MWFTQTSCVCSKKEEEKKKKGITRTFFLMRAGALRQTIRFLWPNRFWKIILKMANFNIDKCISINTHWFLWQEFRFENDTCYLAHCYPYTFTDLKDHLDSLLAQSERRRFLRREVMCETKAGNSCFLLTISNFSGKLILILFFSNSLGII